MNKPYEIDLEERLAYFEQANRFKMMALDLARELGDFHSSINKVEDPGVIFDMCRDRVLQIIGFRQMAFFIVNEDDSDFHLYRCYPVTDKNTIKKELSVLIEDGTFSRAVQEKSPVTAYSEDFNYQLLLHSLATPSRVRGMFVGVLDKKSKHIQEASFEIFSIVMAHCANALESYELYNRLKESNINLQEKVNQLSDSESCLKDEVREHEKTEAALKSSEELYRLLAETANELIIMISDNGQILYLNACALQASGYSKKGLMNRNIRELIDNFNDIMADHHQLYTNIHALLTSKSGDKISLEVNIAPLSNGDAAKGILIVGRDISDRLQEEKEKKHLKEKLWQAQKMKSIGLLASGIAHDFNNILNIIVNYTSLSITDLPEDSPVCGYLGKVETASNRAIQLARKLYTIGRNDDHKKALINIRLTIIETVDLLTSSLGKLIEIKTDFGKDNLIVLAEETRIQQILMNLITNAAHSMADETGTIVVSASQTDIHDETLLSHLDLAQGNYIKLIVTDDGPGIGSENLQRVFDPYFSTKKGKDNSGLGLAVVHGIVKNYNGAIDVQTQKSKGTSFYVYLPEAQEESK